MKQINMNPMSTAPRNGEMVLIRARTASGIVVFHVAKWVDKFSVNLNGGAWIHSTEYEENSTTENRCEGWLPIPNAAQSEEVAP